MAVVKWWICFLSRHGGQRYFWREKFLYLYILIPCGLVSHLAQLNCVLLKWSLLHRVIQSRAQKWGLRQLLWDRNVTWLALVFWDETRGTWSVSAFGTESVWNSDEPQSSVKPPLVFWGFSLERFASQLSLHTPKYHQSQFQMPEILHCLSTAHIMHRGREFIPFAVWLCEVIIW